MRRRTTALLVSSCLLGLSLLPFSASAGCGLGAGQRGVFRSPTTASAEALVYGDSITYQVAERLTTRNAGVAVDAWPGRRTLDAVESLTRDLVGREAPRVVLMALGTNDTRAPWTVGALARHARSAVPAPTRLLWLSTYAEPWPGWAQVNDEIAAVPGVELVDWAGLNLRARGAADRSPLLDDGVHLGCDGAEAWLALVEAALRQP